MSDCSSYTFINLFIQAPMTAICIFIIYKIYKSKCIVHFQKTKSQQNFEITLGEISADSSKN